MIHHGVQTRMGVKKSCRAGGGEEEEDVWRLEVFIGLKSRKEESQRLGSCPLRVSAFLPASQIFVLLQRHRCVESQDVKLEGNLETV